MKKFWNIMQYLLLIIVVLAAALAIYRGDLYFIFKSILGLIFSTTLILENRLTNKNKVVTVAYWASSIILMTLIILECFGFKF